jgi:hypothetical protein
MIQEEARLRIADSKEKNVLIDKLNNELLKFNIFLNETIKK